MNTGISLKETSPICYLVKTPGTKSPRSDICPFKTNREKLKTYSEANRSNGILFVFGHPKKGWLKRKPKEKTRLFLLAGAKSAGQSEMEWPPCALHHPTGGVRLGFIPAGWAPGLLGLGLAGFCRRSLRGLKLHLVLGSDSISHSSHQQA